MQTTFRILLLLFSLSFAPSLLTAQTTTGFSNAPQPQGPGALISRPYLIDPDYPMIPPANGNDSRSLGRTVTINYVNGWLIVGGEVPGSADGSDLSLRVYDVSDPTQLVRLRPSHFGHDYEDLQYEDPFFPDDFWFRRQRGVERSRQRTERPLPFTPSGNAGAGIWRPDRSRRA